MVNEVKFTLAMDGGTAVVTDLDQVGRKLVDVNTKLKDAGSGADAFGGSMRTVGNQLRGFGGDVDGAKGSVDALAHGMKSAFIGSSVAVGLIGLKNTMIDFTQSMVQAQIQVDQLRNGLNFAVGRSNAAGELNFIRESSRTLGLEFVSTSLQYMKLAAAARETSLEGKKARDIFTAVAQASTVMGLSADQTSGSLLAISQMISKNTIMSEELKGQLAERLPGAFQIAARAMGVTTEQLNKMLETGQVVAGDFLPKFARQLSQEVAPEVDAASMSMQASVNRLSNSWTALKQVIVENGAGKSIASGMDSLSKSVAGVAENMKNAKEQGHGFVTQLADLLGGSLAMMIPFVDAPRTFSDRLKEAEAELTVLQKKLVIDPSNAFLKNETYQTYQYVQALREAKKAKDDLSPDYASPAEERRFSLSADAYREKEKLKKTYAELSQELSGVNPKFQAHLSQLKASMDAGIITQGKYVEDVKALIEKEGGVRKEAAKAKSDVGNTIAASIDRANEAALLEIEMGSKVAASDRFRITTLSQISEELRKKNITLERAIALESAMHDAEMKMAQSEAKIKAAKDAADTAKDQEKAITALLEAGQKELDQIDAKIKKQIEANEQIGLTKEQVFSLNAARQMQSALADEEYAQAIRNAAVYAGEYKDAYLQYANALDLAAEKRRKLAGLDAVGASKKAANEAFKEWEKTADKINDALTDALMRGFESGKGFAESLRDSVVSVFKSMAAIKIRAIVEPVGQAAAGLLGFGGAANAGNTVSGLSNLASIGGAGFQAITGSLAGASAASLGYANAVGAVGGDALGALISANGGWAGVSTMATAGEVGALGTAAGAGAGAAGSITSALASIGPVGWAAIAAGAVLALQDHGKPTSNTGNAAANYDSAGNRTGYEVFGGSSEPVDRMLANLQDTYTKAAQALGIGAAATRFTFGGNTGKNGESPNFALGGQAGGKEFYQAETTSSDAAISLAASRAVFAALQGSDLPVYLAKMFDGLSASAMSQDQITNTLAYAQSVKQVRDALLETRDPLQILKDNVARGFVALGTSAERFKVDFVSAIDNGISPDKLAQWQSLQTAMTDLATASGKASDAVKSASRSIADIANERTRLQDRLDELTLTSAQLLDKQRNAIDDSNRSLFDQVTAQESLKAATDSAASAAEAMAQRVGGALASLADARASLQSQLLAAQGDSIGALALTRKTELAKLTDGLSSTDAESVTAAYAYNTALEDQIKALNDAKAAAEAAASAQARAASEAQSAADRISSAWQSITDSIFSEVQRIRGLMGGGGAQSYAQAQAKFSITTAQARAGDQDAARLLPALSQTLLTLAESNATSLTELRRIQGQTSSSLDLTGRGFASQYGLSIPKLDTGTNMVPQDMLALIHKGEAVIPKAYNPVKANGQSNAELLAELRELRALLAQIRDSSKDTASSTRAAEKTLVAVTEGGTGMLIAANSEIPVTVLM